MSYAPATLLAVRSYVITKTGLSAGAVGIVGDVAHGNEGYHVGWDRLKSGYGRGDYSVAESTRDANPTDAAMALDVGNYPGLRELSLWIVAQCQANAPDTADIREVIYSPDGKTVKRWDRLGHQSGGDSSHLFHTHISYFRDSEGRDKTALFKRFFEGGTIMGDYTPLGAPNAVKFADGRVRGDAILLADNWGQEHHGVSPYDGKSKSYRSALLERVDANVKVLLTKPGVELDTNTIAVIAQQVTVAVADAVRPILAEILNETLVERIAQRVADIEAARMRE